MKRITLFPGLILATGHAWSVCVGAEAPADWRVGPTARSFRVFTFYEIVATTASLKP